MARSAAAHLHGLDRVLVGLQLRLLLDGVLVVAVVLFALGLLVDDVLLALIGAVARTLDRLRDGVSGRRRSDRAGELMRQRGVGYARSWAAFARRPF